MSPGSSCSFTSGTPSTDLRFSEYHLEKVSSYLTPSEEDELSLTDRPSRTYSFGSQSETTKSKGKIEILNSSDAGRVRAFSVGSKFVKPRNLTKESHKLPLRSHFLPQSTKSSSAPLLSSSWSGTSRHNQSSNDPMADLMEIDFTENKKKKKNNSSKFRVTPVMESSQLSMDMKSSLNTVTSSADSGYMDMSSKSPSGGFSNSKTQNGSDYCSISPPSVISGSPRTQGFNALFGKSPPKPLNSHFGRSPPKFSPLTGFDNNNSSSNKPFLSPTELNRSEPKNTRLTKPAIVSSSTLKTIGEKPDVKPQKFPTTSSANLNMYALFNKIHGAGTPAKQSGGFKDLRAYNSENIQGKDEQNYMEMGGRSMKKFVRANSDRDVISGKEVLNRSLPEGYVEMSWGGKLTRKLSGDNFVTSHSFDDYMPMTGGSQPIAIKGSSLINSTSKGRTPPKVPTSFLGLGNAGPFGTNRRNSRRKSRKKHERRESKENVIITPTGSNSAIFPMSLSSPTSPKKITKSLKELKEKLNSTNSPCESTETSPMEECLHAELSPNDEDSLYEEMTPGVELEERCFLDTIVDSVQDTVEDASKLSGSLNRLLRISNDEGPSSNYMNFSPRSRLSDDNSGDYACMKPGEFSMDKSSPRNSNNSLGDSNSISNRKSDESTTNITSNEASYGVPYSATANISDNKSDIAQKLTCLPHERGDGLHIPRLASSQVSQPKTVGKNKSQNFQEEKMDALHSRLNLTSNVGDNSRICGSIASVSDSSAYGGDSTDRKTNSLKMAENHASVTRQVSSSSSSSTEVISVKEASSPAVPTTSSLPPCVGGASRPSSTSSEKDITYASLDLGPSGSESEDTGRSPRNLRTQSSVASDSMSCCSNPSVPSESCFNYVKIDFEKSGSLRTPESSSSTTTTTTAAATTATTSSSSSSSSFSKKLHY